MTAEAAATRAVVEAVRSSIATEPGRAVLVRGEPGGGAGPALAELDRRPPWGDGVADRVAVVADLEVLDDRALLELRRRARTAPLVMASEREPSLAVAALLDYLDPVVVVAEPLTIDEVTTVLEAAWGHEVPDRHSALVRRWTAGRAGDVLDVAHHLGASSAAEGPTTEALIGLPASLDRQAGWPAPDERCATWALVTAGAVPEIEVDAPASHGRARPIDAAVVAASWTSAQRREALAAVLDLASAIPARSFGPDSLVQVGSWWCELGRPAIDGPELDHLVAAVQRAFERNRLPEALPMAHRLWVTTHAPLAAVALATALGRVAPDADRVALLDQLAATGAADVADAALATRATWRFHAEHQGEDAIALLRDAGDPGGEGRQGALATLELHRGRPDDVDGLLGTGDDEDGPTSFAVNALVLADLARGRHRRAMDRLDAELERRLDPGPNLSVDRYRFLRTLAGAQAGWAELDEADELDRTYRRALDVGDDWTIGWMGWGAGVRALRTGRFRTARRRLLAAADAFTRADRPGFAMWPIAAAIEVGAVAAIDPADGARGVGRGARSGLSFDHAVVTDRAAADLAVALLARAHGEPTSVVTAALAEAGRAARAAHEVVTAHLVAIEQVLGGFDVTHPPADPGADGVVAEIWPLVATGMPDSWDAAGTTLVERGWPVLGVRLRAAAARRLHRDDLRRATRILQEVQAVVATFEAPLRPWALDVGDLGRLPTLSAREREVAEAVAGGASRDEVATALVVSRRTIDSHLQRVYAKLGVTSRAELRAWLDQ